MTQHQQTSGKPMNALCQCEQAYCHGELGESCGRQVDCWLVSVSELREQSGFCPACARNGLAHGRLMDAADKDVAYSRLAYALNQRENKGFLAAASEFRLQWFHQDGTAQFEHRWKRIWVKLQPNGDCEVKPKLRTWWKICLWTGVGIGLVWPFCGIYAVFYVMVLVIGISLSRVYGLLEKQRRLRDELTQCTNLVWSGKMQHPRQEAVKTITAKTILKFSALEPYK